MSIKDRKGIGMTSARTRDRLLRRLMESGIRDHRVLDAMRHTPRHLFVDEALASRAYEDVALPIGYGQTISQPFIVGLMTQNLVEDIPHPGKVLEIGTGCGYQAAILSQIFDQVVTVERIKELYKKARDLLYELGYRNVRAVYGDGLQGWVQGGPYDAILMAAAPETLPDALLDQLALGGRLIAPIGGRGFQRLIFVERQEDGFPQKMVEHVNFVPTVAGTE
ncbi:MAG: protein-L-isoaspartate(D-aspartate) O-methyltransferase [Gammaproteobacteria bacterium]|nr:protein-L-isoaspartate(D-aspartate) O-methyltransferase [Gammaproteobacteria bacterium]